MKESGLKMDKVEQSATTATIVSWSAFVVCLFASCGQNKADRSARLSSTSRKLLHREPKPIIPCKNWKRKRIVSALTILGGDKVLAAKGLAIGKTTLCRKLREFGIGEESKPHNQKLNADHSALARSSLFQWMRVGRCITLRRPQPRGAPCVV